MTREEAIAIIRKEYLCVNRDCDIERSCGKCDLMMPSKEPILEAYKMAMDALEQDCDKCEYANPCLYCKHEFSLTSTDEPMTMVYKGTPIPDNATNGDVFNAIYADISRTGTVLLDDIENIIATNVNIGWWNAPYLKGGKT